MATTRAQEDAPAVTARGRPQAWAVLLGLVCFAGAAAYPIRDNLFDVAPWFRMVDLEVYLDAGRSLRSGRPVYDHLSAAPSMLPFTYPPLPAIIALPLSLLPLVLVQVLWTLAQLGALAAVVAMSFDLVRARVGRWSPVLVGVVAGACTWLVPMSDGLYFGQVGIFLVALCLADMTGRIPRLPRGALIGLATAIKLTPGVFLVHLWTAGRQRAAVTAVATAASLTLLVAVALPETSWAYWTGAIFDSDRLGSNEGTSNQSLRGALLRVGPDGAAGSVLWLLAAALVAAYGLHAAARASQAGDALRATALVGLLTVLLSPVAWIHHLVWIVVVLGAVVGDGRSRARWAGAVAIGVYFSIALPWRGTRMLGTDVPVWWARTLQQSYVIGAIVLLVVLGSLLHRSARTGASTPESTSRVS